MNDLSYETLKMRMDGIKNAIVSEKRGELEFRIGEKGGVSVYGLGRFPTTLYYEQWKKLLAVVKELDEFLESNKSKLKLKPKTTE